MRDNGATARRPKRRSPRPDWQSGSSQFILERVRRDSTAKTLNGGEVVRKSPEWRARDQVEAEGTICITSKYHCRTWSNKSRTAKKSVSDAGSKYVNKFRFSLLMPSPQSILNFSLQSSLGREQQHTSWTTLGLHNGRECGNGQGSPQPSQ